MPTPTPPIVVNPSPLGAQAASALRVAVMVLTALVAILGFVKTRDLAGLIVYLQSAEFVPVAAAITGLATFLYSQWKTRRDRARLVTAADAAPDRVAIVTDPKGA